MGQSFSYDVETGKRKWFLWTSLAMNPTASMTWIYQRYIFHPYRANFVLAGIHADVGE